MLEEKVRPIHQKACVDPLVNRIGSYVRPNTITLLSALLGLAVIPLLTVGAWGWAVVFLLVSGYCDTLDGSIARYRDLSSDWGSVLDIVCDRTVEWAVLFAIWLQAPEERALGVILMLGSILLCITSFLVVGIFSENRSDKSFHYSPGLVERAEAFAFFIVMMIWPQSFRYLWPLFTILVLWTTLHRLRQFYRQAYPQSQLLS